MAKKLDLTGTQQAPSAPSTAMLGQALAPFMARGEPITTMTVQVPIRLRSICYSREADRSTSRCSRTERARFRALRSSVF